MSTRRKFSSTGPVEPIPLHGSKRRKVSEDGGHTDDIETPQKTTEVGLKLIEDIKQATDKNGRLIANEFFQLPDKKRHADYYKVIALPISLDGVVGKLHSHKYANLTELESDLKRLVSNAKKYNEKGSLLFADAERIRKIVTATMPKINPAYNDPNYVPFPTPIPDQVQAQAPSNNGVEDSEGREQNADAEADAEDEKSVQPSDQALEKDEHEELNFEGNTIQLAQDKIISELIHLKDERGREVGAPFLYKPDRNLYKEYYEIIQHPVSLRSILKQVRGIEGRKPHSRKTAFPNWRSFEEEMEFVWGNAREFNEDDSEIVDLAKILEAHFKRRLAEAKSVVPDPVQDSVDEVNPRIKLKLSSKTPEPASQRLMLRFSGQKSSSVEDKTPAPASLDGDSVQRQQELAKADIAGQRSVLSTAQESRETPDYTRLGPAAHALGQGSPMPTSIITPSPFQTPIPSTTSANVLMHSMTGGQIVNPWPSGNPPAQTYQSYASVESVFRKANQDASDALIKDLAIKSHSSLGARPKFSLHFPASATMRQQSLVVNIPASQNFLSLSVKIAPSTAQKRTKFVALFGPQKVILAPQPHSLPTELFYDIRLPLGLTKVDFQMASSIRPTGQENTTATTIHAAEDKREFERLTVYFRVVR